MFVSFIVLSEGCSHRTPSRSIEVDTDYTFTKKYIFTKPESEIELYRFQWVEWQQLANSTRDRDAPPTAFPDREYRALDNSYTLAIPRLSGKKVFFDDRRYPVDPTAKFIMMDENGWVAGIQSTKIRDDYPKDDSLLTDLVAKNRISVHGVQLNSDGIGRVEMVFLNCQNRLILQEKLFDALMMLPFFFSSGHGYSNDPGKPLRINRCIVRNGYFIEISVYTVAEFASDEKFTEKAAIEISDYILSNILGEVKQKQQHDIKIFNHDKIPDTLKYKVLGKVHGYDPSKNGMNISSASLDMKRNALKKYGTDVDAIISTQYSYYGGYYGKGGTNAYGLAIKILQE